MNTFAFFKDRIVGLIYRKGFDLDTAIPIEKSNFVVLDTELTGLELGRDSIISIGAVKMKGSRIDLQDSFYRLVNPSTRLKPQSIVVHGITPSEVQDKPDIESALYELIGFCKDNIIVGHFISLDMNFLNREARRIYGTHLRNYVIDTNAIYEWITQQSGEFKRHFGEFSEEHSLSAVAKRYNISVNGAHNALADAFITAQLFQKFLSFLPGIGVRTLRDLLRIGKP